MGLFQQPVREWCFPAQARHLPWARAVALALRAGHLAAMAFLLGGHAYGADPEALFPWLLAAVVTGAGLMATEVLTWGLHWFTMAKGIGVLAKLALLLVIPFAWGARVPILLVVLVASAVTSHMPARFRNYSFLYGRRMDPAGGQGRDPRSVV
jgi:hypothetical protein